MTTVNSTLRQSRTHPTTSCGIDKMMCSSCLEVVLTCYHGVAMMIIIARVYLHFITPLPSYSPERCVHFTASMSVCQYVHPYIFVYVM